MTRAAEAAWRRWWGGVFAPDVIAREVAGDGAIADLVGARFDAGALAARERAGIAPLVDWWALSAALACRHGAPMARDVAAALGISESSARRALGEAAAAGAVVRDGARFRTRADFRPVVARAVAVELKLRDWPKALVQAERYRDFADAAWVVLGAAGARAAYAACVERGVGLASLDADGAFRRVVAPRPRRPRRAEATALLVGEQLLAQAARAVRATSSDVALAH